MRRPRLTRRALFLSLLFALFPLTATAQTPNAWINELHYDDTGGGNDFVEVVVENASSVDLGKLDVEKYRDNGTRYSPIGDADTDFVQEKTVGPFTIYTWTTTLQNGPSDGLALCFDDAPLQVISYEGTFTGDEQCADGETSTDIGVSEDGSNPNTTSLQLEGSGGSYSDFTWTGPTSNTKGDVNTGQTLSNSTTLIVDDNGSGDYTSIQTAIDDASGGDEIEVKAGQYGEDVTVDKQLTLEGPNVGTPGDDSRGSEATLEGQVILSASDVVFDGFDVSPPPATSNPEGEAVRISDGADGVVVKNNIVRDFTEDFDSDVEPWSEDVGGIVAFGGGNDPVETVTIEDNLVKNIDGRDAKGGAVGISIQGHVEGATVQNNEIKNVGMGTSAFALAIAIRSTDNPVDEDPEGVSVKGNVVEDIFPNDSGLDGVGFEFEPKNESNVASLTVENNTFNSTTLQVEDKTSDRGLSGLDLESILADNTFDRAAVIVGSSGDIKVGPNSFRKVYSSLSAPVSDAAPNGIVELKEATGTYAGDLTIDKPLTLRGDASSPSPAAKATASCTKPAVIDASGNSQGITFTAGSVTLTDLCVKNADNHNLYTDATISDLTLTGVEALNAGNYGLEVHNNATLSNLTVADSRFAESSSGIRIRGNLSTAQISGTAFENNGIGFHTTQGQDATEAPDPSDITSATGVTIESSTFTGNTKKSIYTEKLSDSVFDDISVTDGEFDINLKYDDYSNITIKNSTIEDVTTGTGLYVKARNDESGNIDYKTVPASLSGLVITGNTVTGNTAGSGIALQHGIQDATIVENLIQENGNEFTRDGLFIISGLSIYGSQDADASGPDVNLDGLLINDNCIVNNAAYDLLVGIESSASVDAENNWWGTASGPVAGTDFTDNSPNIVSPAQDDVDADPFSDVPLFDGCGGGAGQCDVPGLAGADDVDKEAGTVKNTITDDDGIDKVTFTKLDGLKVVSSFPSGFSKDGNKDEAGVTWTWEGDSGQQPTSVDFTLGATKSNVSYFAEVTDACPAGGKTLELDPSYKFEPDVAQVRLAGNAPNPFRGQTTVEFALPERSRVTMSIYDMMGRKVATLVDGVRSGGPHSVSWNGQSDGGQSLASGVYLLRMQADGQSETQRLTIVR